MGHNKKQIELRMLRVELDYSETEIFVISLMDMKKYPCELFSEL